MRSQLIHIFREGTVFSRAKSQEKPKVLTPEVTAVPFVPFIKEGSDEI
jgi:hypothetical protein